MVLCLLNRNKIIDHKVLKQPISIVFELLYCYFTEFAAMFLWYFQQCKLRLMKKFVFSCSRILLCAMLRAAMSLSLNIPSYCGQPAKKLYLGVMTIKGKSKKVSVIISLNISSCCVYELVVKAYTVILVYCNFSNVLYVFNIRKHRNSGCHVCHFCALGVPCLIGEILN